MINATTAMATGAQSFTVECLIVDWRVGLSHQESGQNPMRVQRPVRVLLQQNSHSTGLCTLVGLRVRDIYGDPGRPRKTNNKSA